MFCVIKFLNHFIYNFVGSVYFVVNGIIAFRSILQQLHNPMSHEYYILFYSTVFTNPIVNRLTPGHTNPKRSKSKPPKQNEPKPQQELNPKLVQRFPLYTPCALSTEVSRSRGNLAQNGALKPMTSLTAK